MNETNEWIPGDWEEAGPAGWLRGVDAVGGQWDCGQGQGTPLALFPLVGHKCWKRVELLLTLPAEKDILII